MNSKIMLLNLGRLVTILVTITIITLTISSCKKNHTEAAKNLLESYTGKDEQVQDIIQKLRLPVIKLYYRNSPQREKSTGIIIVHSLLPNF